MGSLCLNDSTAAWRDALATYEDVVARQGVARLAELDRWFRDELPGAITARRSPHVTHDELVRMTEWVWDYPRRSGRSRFGDAFADRDDVLTPQ